MISANITQLTSDYDVLIVPGETAGFSQKDIASIRNSVANSGAYFASINDVTKNS